MPKLNSLLPNSLAPTAIGLLLALTAFTPAAPASAQDYPTSRCGSSFRSRPAASTTWSAA